MSHVPAGAPAPAASATPTATGATTATRARTGGALPSWLVLVLAALDVYMVAIGAWEWEEYRNKPRFAAFFLRQLLEGLVDIDYSSARLQHPTSGRVNPLLFPAGTRAARVAMVAFPSGPLYFLTSASPAYSPLDEIAVDHLYSFAAFDWLRRTLILLCGVDPHPPANDVDDHKMRWFLEELFKQVAISIDGARDGVQELVRDARDEYDRQPASQARWLGAMEHIKAVALAPPGASNAAVRTLLRCMSGVAQLAGLVEVEGRTTMLSVRDDFVQLCVDTGFFDDTSHYHSFEDIATALEEAANTKRRRIDVA